MCWDFLRGNLHQVCPVVFSPSFNRTLEETFLVSLTNLIFLWHKVISLSTSYSSGWLFSLLMMVSYMEVYAFSVFCFYVYLSTPFPIMLCQKMVFTPSKALSLRPVRRTAREQSPAKPTAGCDPRKFQTLPIIICKECYNEKISHTPQFIYCIYSMFNVFSHNKLSNVSRW